MNNLFVFKIERCKNIVKKNSAIPPNGGFFSQSEIFFEKPIGSIIENGKIINLQ